MSREHLGNQKARCPECLAAIWLKDGVEMWDPVTCPECHTLLEVSNVRPLTLDYVEGGWGDEGFEEDEEAADWQ